MILNLRNKPVEFTGPAVMAIINATDNSFFPDATPLRQRIERAIGKGADIIDLGACSTRPGSTPPSSHQELAALIDALRTVREINGDIPVSVDTFRASVAEAALSEGADIINDVTAGADPGMFPLIARARVPYVIMHMRGTPQTMQSLTDYTADGGVVAHVITSLAEKINHLRTLGILDIIVDPGFGFAKTVEQNFQLLHSLPLIRQTLQCPVLAGLSRKSMLYKPLGLTPADVLPATCAANLLAIQGGVDILRVHDVGAACQVRHIAGC